MNNTCPSCHAPVTEANFFCPACGKKIKEPPIILSIGKIIGVYALSLFLPPLGLWPALKYIKQKDQKIRTVGFIAIMLTALSILITLWISIGIMGEVNRNIHTQLLQYQDLGL